MTDETIGFKHFKEFYSKLNVISKIIVKKKLVSVGDFDRTFNNILSIKSTSGAASPVEQISDEPFDSNTLIDTFGYTSDKGETSIAKKLTIGSYGNSVLIEITTKAETSPWSDIEFFSIFNYDSIDERSTLKELHNLPDYTQDIRTLFRYRANKNTQYVWTSKNDMLVLLDQHFLLLTFDMYNYNRTHTYLFEKNFDIKPIGTETTATALNTAKATFIALSVRNESMQKLVGELTAKHAEAERAASEAAVAVVAPGTEVAARAAARLEAAARAAMNEANAKQLSIQAELDDANKALDKAEAAHTEAKSGRKTKMEDVEKKKIQVYNLIDIDTFPSAKIPTFLMLLIYYAGYSFGIQTDDITSKFRNKFNQSSNKTSFPIKLYVPISQPNETMYNSVLNSHIKPETVDLSVESLEVYHVGGKIASLWDYVNGKLTILIHNMLNANKDIAKDYYKTWFRKTYSLNKLFLFECISELKKYKEYILNPVILQSLEFPVSTLKTLEILILKLSYILSVLEPTFIPIETMSFDVVMNGKTLKYVINSELQATNISINDSVSTDNLMMAILSTRAAVMDSIDAGSAGAKDKGESLLSEHDAITRVKDSVQKEYDAYRSESLEKTIAFNKINIEYKKSSDNMTKVELEYNKIEKAKRDKLVSYVSIKVQHAELMIAYYQANIQNLQAIGKVESSKELLDALHSEVGKKDGMLPAKAIFDKSRELPGKIVSEIDKITREKADADENLKILQEQLNVAKETSLADATKIYDEAEKAGKRQAEFDAKLKPVLGPSKPYPVTVATQQFKEDTFRLSFGELDIINTSDFKLGKILNVNNSNKPTADDLFKKEIRRGFRLVKIDQIDPSTGMLIQNIWNVDIDPDNPDTIYSMVKIGNKFSSFTVKGKYDSTETIHVNLVKFQNLKNKLANITVGKTYNLYFEPPDPPKNKASTDSFSGGKNTTKKVNRKQRQAQRQAQRQGQTHSKTKKVFESEVIN